MTGRPRLRIGIAGYGGAGRLHLDRLLALSKVEVVGCALPDRGYAESPAERIGPTPAGKTTPVFGHHRELIGAPRPDTLCIFTPHLLHYWLPMDSLQACCHILIEKPLSTNVQEAADIVRLAQGRQLKVGMGHQYRLCPSLKEARRVLTAGAVGKMHLVSAPLARLWANGSERSANDWKFEPRFSGGGVRTDAGDHLIDTLLWSTRQTAEVVYAVQSKHTSGLDLVAAASLCLRDWTPATPAVSGACSESVFELHSLGERGRMRVTDLGSKAAGKPSLCRLRPKAVRSKKPSMEISCPQSSPEPRFAALPRRHSGQSDCLTP
jgi:predicted dehydrogenase